VETRRAGEFWLRHGLEAKIVFVRQIRRRVGLNRLSRTKIRKEALFAIAFASGILGAPAPALCDTVSQTNSSFADSIEKNNGIKPELRAYYLLRIANGYLEGDTEAHLQKLYAHASKATDRDWPTFERRPEDVLNVFMSTVCSVGSHAQKRKKTEANSVSNENIAVANSLIGNVLTVLSTSNNEYLKLNLVMIASQLFRKAENADGIKRCNEILDKGILDCEENVIPDTKQIKAAMSVLNFRADRILHVPIYDTDPSKIASNSELNPVSTKAGEYSENDFRDSQTLRLRAVELADRLEVTEHLRRKAHRDMSLWYQQLGKAEAADKHKQILFELVGVKDDKILYPLNGMCGHLVWWQLYVTGGFCGMG